MRPPAAPTVSSWKVPTIDSNQPGCTIESSLDKSDEVARAGRDPRVARLGHVIALPAYAHAGHAGILLQHTLALFIGELSTTIISLRAYGCASTCSRQCIRRNGRLRVIIIKLTLGQPIVSSCVSPRRSSIEHLHGLPTNDLRAHFFKDDLVLFPRSSEEGQHGCVHDYKWNNEGQRAEDSHVPIAHVNKARQ